MVTPPSTPPVYSVKIADFGLARETSSKMPYTTYVSTRWYRAPEVLLRAGEYSAPVDIWAIGAMAVEVATLKPLFPGGNEVDQVWRVCEVMGSPGQWVGRSGKKMGGGEWREGTRLAGRLGFSFPRVSLPLRGSFSGSANFFLVQFLIETDGTCPNGVNPRRSHMARFAGKLCHLVSNVGSPVPADIDPSTTARILPRCN